MQLGQYGWSCGTNSSGCLGAPDLIVQRHALQDTPPHRVEPHYLISSIYDYLACKITPSRSCPVEGHKRKMEVLAHATREPRCRLRTRAPVAGLAYALNR